MTEDEAFAMARAPLKGDFAIRALVERCRRLRAALMSIAEHVCNAAGDGEVFSAANRALIRDDNRVPLGDEP